MSLKRVSYKDPSGRKKIILLPEEASEEEAERGILVGPPDLTSLGLPEELEVRLNNELFNREIVTALDATRRRSDVVSAMQAAFKVDANSIIALYLGEDYQSANTEPTENISNTPVSNRRPRQSR